METTIAPRLLGKVEQRVTQEIDFTEADFLTRVNNPALAAQIKSVDASQQDFGVYVTVHFRETGLSVGAYCDNDGDYTDVVVRNEDGEEVDDDDDLVFCQVNDSPFTMEDALPVLREIAEYLS